MEDLGALQTFLGTGGGIIVAALVEAIKRTILGIVPDEWWNRAIPLLCFILAAVLNVVVANGLRSTGQSVTFNGWVLAFYTIMAGLSAMGLYSGQKSVRGG
jgi:hypothetical protein